jgi:hypothetical protein
MPEAARMQYEAILAEFEGIPQITRIEAENLAIRLIESAKNWNPGQDSAQPLLHAEGEGAQ